jgi:hypothetical protein
MTEANIHIEKTTGHCMDLETGRVMAGRPVKREFNNLRR